jgi:hypothetical protein
MLPTEIFAISFKSFASKFEIESRSSYESSRTAYFRTRVFNYQLILLKYAQNSVNLNLISVAFSLFISHHIIFTALIACEIHSKTTHIIIRRPTLTRSLFSVFNFMSSALI